MEKRKTKLDEKPTLLGTLKTHLLLILLASMLGILLPVVLSVFLGIACIISGNEASCQISNSSETAGYLVEMILKIWQFILGHVIN